MSSVEPNLFQSPVNCSFAGFESRLYQCQKRYVGFILTAQMRLSPDMHGYEMVIDVAPMSYPCSAGADACHSGPIAVRMRLSEADHVAASGDRR